VLKRFVVYTLARRELDNSAATARYPPSPSNLRHPYIRLQPTSSRLPCCRVVLGGMHASKWSRQLNADLWALILSVLSAGRQRAERENRQHLVGAEFCCPASMHCIIDSLPRWSPCPPG